MICFDGIFSRRWSAPTDSTTNIAALKTGGYENGLFSYKWKI
jgi:hypothetical protein